MKKCVFYELNQDYKDGCLVSVKSLLNHNDIDVFVYCINFIDIDFENKLKQISSKINVVFYNIKTDLKCIGGFNSFIDVISSKFLIFNELLKKYDSVLFLDCDILIRKNLSEIFENKNGIYGCNDSLENVFISKYRKTFFRKFKSNIKSYINAGFVLVNNYTFDINQYKEIIRKYSFYYPEQDYLNMLEHKVLDIKYCGNHYCSKKILETDFYAFHYFGDEKPFRFIEKLEYIQKVKYIEEYFNVTNSIKHLLTERFISNVERNLRLYPN